MRVMTFWCWLVALIWALATKVKLYGLPRSDYYVYVVLFFFSSRRRHTRLQGDWSSDVCSSDLRCSLPRPTTPIVRLNRRYSPAAGSLERSVTFMATTVQSSRPNAWRRMWHTPTSKAALYWLIFAAIYTAIFYVLYAVLFNAPIFTGPWFDHVFRVGVMSYLLILDRKSVV